MSDFSLPEGFLFGAATSAHQIEGNNVNSDMWAFENRPGSFFEDRSGDAADSYHRWPEDMDLLRDLGFTAYRFSIEWARIEPARGHFSRAEIAHYRRMVDGARARGLEPVVTLHHFTAPLWFTALGGWSAPDAPELFAAFAAAAAPILADAVRYVATINEPNILALMHTIVRRGVQDRAAMAEVLPDDDLSEGLISSHRAARAVLRRNHPGIQVGWTVANQVYQPEPGAEPECREFAWPREDRFLEVAREDDWIGVQSYTRTKVGVTGPIPVPDDVEKTITGWEYYPAALGEAVRHTSDVVGPGVPILVTENGIATDDDARRVDYTSAALAGLAAAMRDGADVRAYLHWSALDNYEWGSYRPTFGLIAVDRETFERVPKASARWLGGIARSGRVPIGG
jgi:beta-glucosidase